MGDKVSGEEVAIIEAMKSAGIPGAVAVAIVWAALFRKRDAQEPDDKFAAFYREVIDRLARIETELNLTRDKR